jgi:deferrochelatase/peroxidase EfeB
VSDLDRRGFLRGAAIGGAVAAASAIAGRVGSDEPSGEAHRADAAPFHGEHQSGIVTPRRASTAVVALDLATRTRGDLEELLRTLTERMRFLTSGGVPENSGISSPPADSGILGPDIPSDGLTATLGLGSSVFDTRFGLADRKPQQLRPMDTFPNDNLDRTQCDGDLLLQLSAHHPDTVVHALRDLTRSTGGAMQPRWRIDGAIAPPRPSGAPRNYFGFKDGTAGPDVTDAALMRSLVWVQPDAGEPAWAAGGTYQVVRIIRMLTEFWDRVSASEQEQMIGRRKDTGAPFTGRRETDIPNYDNDPAGDATPLSAHIRVANPRTAKTETNRILRRGFNYDHGIDSNGNLDMGLVFTAYQQDLDRQFVTIQKRLADEPMVDYISPVGGGYFFVVPGVRNGSDWLGSGLFA